MAYITLDNLCGERIDYSPNGRLVVIVEKDKGMPQALRIEISFPHHKCDSLFYCTELIDAFSEIITFAGKASNTRDLDLFINLASGGKHIPPRLAKIAAESLKALFAMQELEKLQLKRNQNGTSS